MPSMTFRSLVQPCFPIEARGLHDQSIAILLAEEYPNHWVLGSLGNSPVQEKLTKLIERFVQQGRGVNLGHALGRAVGIRIDPGRTFPMMYLLRVLLRSSIEGYNRRVQPAGLLRSLHRRGYPKAGRPDCRNATGLSRIIT
jgi:hypothetical protein